MVTELVGAGQPISDNKKIYLVAHISPDNKPYSTA